MAIDFEDPEVKAEIASQVEKTLSEKVAEVENRYKTDIQKLTANRDEILQEKRRLVDLERSLGDMKIDDVKQYVKQLQESQEAKLISEGKIDELLSQKIEKTRADYEGKLESMQKEMSTRDERIAKLMIDQDATQQFIGAGGLPDAVSDAVYRARQIFRVEDGDLVPRDANGEIVMGENGVLTMKEFMASDKYLKGAARHLYAQAHGVGARGGNGTGGQEPNPWAKETLNLTQQARVLKENPEKAALLQSAAGKR